MSGGKVDYPSLGVPKLVGGFAEADRQTIAGIILSLCAISSQCAIGTEGPLSISSADASSSRNTNSLIADLLHQETLASKDSPTDPPRSCKWQSARHPMRDEQWCTLFL